MRLLNSHQVEYLLVGGYAVCYHGYYRNTGDMDIWIAVNPENAAKMAQLVREFGFESPDVNESVFLEKGRLIRMGMEPVRIEILTEISGCEFSECYPQRVDDFLDGEKVSIISLPDLLRNKVQSGRLKDLADVEKLK